MSTKAKQRMMRSGIILVTLLTTAVLCAQGSTRLLAAWLLPQEGATPSAGKASSRGRAAMRSPQRLRPRQVATRILDRNIFDSETGPLTYDAPPPPVEVIVTETEEEILVVGEPEKCAGSIRLVAAMVIPRVPHLSFAALSSGGDALLYRAGMAIDDHEVVGIREQRVFLQPEGKPLCQVKMFDPDGSPKKSSARRSSSKAKKNEAAKDKNDKKPRTSAARKRRKGAISDEDLDQGITKNNDSSYTVSRGLVDKVLTNQAELMRSARVIPYEQDGRVVGVKMYGIRRNSLLGRLGVQNGDVLRNINGFDLSSPDSALEAYSRLRSADQLNLAITRRGKPVNLDYGIR